MNVIYQLVVEEDNFYDTKEFYTYLFESKADAEEYRLELIEAYKNDFMERLECETEDQLLNEYLDITESSFNYGYINMYIEDDCNVCLYVEEKSILRFS
jgi:hypothetical protein